MKLSIFASILAWSLAAAASPNRSFISFCYHDIPTRVQTDRHAIDVRSFIEQIELMRARGASFVSAKDLLRAKERGEELPPQAVLLTFDDGCASFYKNVFPILEMYRIPAVLAVVTSWPGAIIDADCEGGDLMTFAEISEVAASGLVEIASHSHAMHTAVPMGPQGHTAPAATTFRYDQKTKSYETIEQYRARITADLTRSKDILKEHLGQAPRVLVWPYGAYNRVAIAQAQKLGFELLLTADDTITQGLGDLDRLDEVPRWMLLDQIPIDLFAEVYWAGGVVPHTQPTAALRAVHVDLDLVYDDDQAQLQRNVDELIERMVAIKPNVIYLQAFRDNKATGNVSEVYFPNSVLPMKADLFGRVARALELRGLAVFAWMPMLSILLPDAEETAGLRVRTIDKNGVPREAHAPYRRLSPFSQRARAALFTLYEDLAKAAPIAGILFQDDAYLEADEDFHESAHAAFLEVTGRPITEAQKLDEVARRDWVAHKTRTLDELGLALGEVVRRYRPTAKLSRTLYARTLLEPESEAWLAQSYRTSVLAYDEVVVMAYPLMEQTKDPEKWLRSLVSAAKQVEHGIDKTMFKVQTVDWRTGRCIPTATVKHWLRVLVQAGAKHVAYYPDNLFDDCPKLTEIREAVSTEAFPFIPERRAR